MTAFSRDSADGSKVYVQVAFLPGILNPGGVTVLNSTALSHPARSLGRVE